ncbi:MAG TPA: DUF6305 family protein [Synergistales bacterium]|nr:DUF6305 family protein [Synergistales bacterium]
MKRIILCVVAAALFLSCGLTLPAMVSSAAASEIVLTSVGQSPDATMIRVVLRKMKINAENQPLLRPEGLAGEKILVAVVGGSSKGLGAAGIDKDQEIERVTGLFQSAKQKGMKLLIMHIGGEGRRGTLSDAFIEAAAPHADRLIVVDGGNNDKIFDHLVEGKNVKILTAPNVNGTAEPLKATLSEWGVSAQ